MQFNKIKTWLYNKKKIIQFSSLLLISFIMIFASNSYYRKGFISVGFYITTFAQKIISSSSEASSNINDLYSTKKQLLKKNSILEKENEKLKKTLVQFSTLENQLFLAQKKIDNSKYIIHNSIPVSIIAKSSDSLGDFFVLDKGSSSGIRKDSSVVAVQEKNVILIGKIIATTPYSSSFFPIYHNSLQIGARLKEQRYEGIIKGNGSFNKGLTMYYVNRVSSDLIKYGEKIITSGLSSIYPPGLLIGKIISLKEDIEGPSLNLTIKSLANFNNLEYVYIIPNNRGKKSE